MSSKRNGVRNVRTKEAVVEILKDNPQGLAAFQIGDFLSESAKASFCRPSNRQLGQILSQLRGVEMSDDKMYARDVITNQMKEYNMWLLVDEERFIEWKTRELQKR